jgi:TonB family protein
MANKLTALVLACGLSAATNSAAQYVRGEWSSTSAPRSMRSEAELKAEIAAQPASVRAYLELAQLYRMNSRPHDAETTLRAALAVTSQVDPVYGALIGLYPPMYNPEQVLSIADEWRRASPANVRPLWFTITGHVEFARRLRMTQPHEAVTHIEQALRAVEDARTIAADDPTVDSAHANALGMKAEFATDPPQRAQLLQQAEELMRKSRTRMAQSPRGPFAIAGGSSGGVAEAPPPSPGGAVRVGGHIAQPQKIKDVRPQYPPEAQQARIKGVVILEIVVGADGKVTSANVLRSIPMLDQAAIDAVRQWEFTPTLLNGVAVPVIMTVTVDFNLE